MSLPAVSYHSASVIRRGDRPKSFLPCSVPVKQPDSHTQIRILTSFLPSFVTSLNLNTSHWFAVNPTLFFPIFLYKHPVECADRGHGCP